MAIRPDYDIGELTLTSGSSDFTTSGSSLQTAAVQAGDAIIAPSGHVLIIASITGQNSGTLFLPCPPDAAGTGLPLRIRFQPDGSRYQGAVRVLIDLLSSGNLEAFAALVGAAGMVPIFTGPGTMDLADPATFGIQDPNGNLGDLAGLDSVDNLSVLADLPLAARQILQTDENGVLAQSPLGLLGQALLGSTDVLSALSTLGPVFGGSAPAPSEASVGLSDGDFNTINVPGVYTIAGTWSNGPNGTAVYTGILEVKARRFNNLYVQTLYQGADVYQRTTNVPDALNWLLPWDTVSRYGSNSNGQYWRLAGGLQIVLSNPISLNNNLQRGAIYGSDTITAIMPADFVGDPVPFGGLINTVTAWVAPRCNSTSWVFSSFSYLSRTGDQVILGALGRWQ